MSKKDTLQFNSGCLLIRAIDKYGIIFKGNKLPVTRCQSLVLKNVKLQTCNMHTINTFNHINRRCLCAIIDRDGLQSMLLINWVTFFISLGSYKSDPTVCISLISIDDYDSHHHSIFHIKKAAAQCLKRSRVLFIFRFQIWRYPNSAVDGPQSRIQNLERRFSKDFPVE